MGVITLDATRIEERAEQYRGAIKELFGGVGYVKMDDVHMIAPMMARIKILLSSVKPIAAINEKLEKVAAPDENVTGCLHDGGTRLEILIIFTGVKMKQKEAV